MIHKKWILRDILKNVVSIFNLCLFAFLIIGCTSGRIAYRMVNKDNTHIDNLEKSKIGMTKAEVVTLMGTADKSEKFERTPDKGWQDIDSTPVVFEAGILKGWGKYYYEERLGMPQSP